MPNEKKSWFFRAADGGETGPLSETDLRAFVVSGEVSSETPVSRGDGIWKPAVAFDECGFDCLVLRTEPSLDVLGPFSREYLDRPDVMETLPGDGRFFVRSGTVADAAAVPGSPGSSGASLVERVLSAERALRDTVGKLGELGKLLSELDEAKRALAAKAAALTVANKALADAKKALGEKDAALADAKKSLSDREAALSALRGDAEWLRGAVSGLLSEAGRRFGAEGPAAVPATDVIEPEVVAVPETTNPASPERDRPSKMAALESQLQKELRMAGSAPLRNLFKKR